MKVTAKAKSVAKARVAKKAKEASARMAVIAQTPTPKDISKSDSKRPQYSVKCKKRLMKYAMRHSLTPKEVEIGTKGKVSVGQARSWEHDLIDGRFNLKHSVAVSRS